MAVLPDQHGRGLGTTLIRDAERYARKQGRSYLTVKTLSASRSDVNYDKTRRFYSAVGFVPLEEFKTLWGEHNPCLLMIKAI
jgi:GNAT superfamily N-acetyltransferase